MFGELTFFFGLQVYQLDKGTFISQIKYIKDMLKKFKIEESKPVSTRMIIVVVYVDAIIFGRNLQILSVYFVFEMKKEFEMSMLGELIFFLGL